MNDKETKQRKKDTERTIRDVTKLIRTHQPDFVGIITYKETPVGLATPHYYGGRIDMRSVGLALMSFTRGIVNALDPEVGWEKYNELLSKAKSQKASSRSGSK